MRKKNQYLCIVRLSRGEEGRLLDWEGVQSDTTIFILPPDATDLQSGGVNSDKI